MYDETATYISDTIGRVTTAYTVLGGLTWSSNATSHQVFGYDPMGRINNEYEWGPSNVYLGPVSAAYDLTGDLTALNYPSGRVVKFGYNSAAQLNNIQFDNWSGTPVGYNYWSVNNANFYPNGAPKLVSLGNGVIESTVLSK